MDDQLKGLRKSMEKTTFKQLNFSEDHRKKVHEKINRKYENDEDVYLAVLQLLMQEQTGYDLTELLRARGIQRFEDNEGFLYTLLHRLEHSGVIISSWDSAGDKYYQLNDKGRKMLLKAEKSSQKKRFVLKELIQE
ncbi:PadR family transcriptional regulator [Virgibacillus flavescens]|uniref:PadR family transcriptional regulator n=1 Tax=Virgibacillus flavescens TaxID=1611422 RepID=UPI003D348C9F